jgi:hypothetical protein
MRSNSSTVVGNIPELEPTLAAKKDVISLPSSESRSVALPSLSAGSLITINTRNTCYRMRVVDGPSRRVLITGGLLFPQSTEVEVIGASDDSGVRDGFVVEGLQLELSTPRGPILTSTVMTLSVEAGTAADLSSLSA